MDLLIGQCQPRALANARRTAGYTFCAMTGSTKYADGYMGGTNALTQVALDLIRPEVAGTAPASRRASLGGTFRRAAERAVVASASIRGDGSRLAEVVASIARSGSAGLMAAMEIQQREADRRFAYLVDHVCR